MARLRFHTSYLSTTHFFVKQIKSRYLMSNGLYYVSSLKINLEKSELNEGFQLDNELGCRRGSFHTNYLGTQFGAQSIWVHNLVFNLRLFQCGI